MRYFLFLFIVVPLVELYLLLFLGHVIGFWPTVGIVLVTGTLGASLAKHEGLKVLHGYRDSLANGQLPSDDLVEGLLVLIGGVLLITPGVLTDLTGLLLMFGRTRRVVAGWIRAAAAKKIKTVTDHAVQDMFDGQQGSSSGTAGRPGVSVFTFGDWGGGMPSGPGGDGGPRYADVEVVDTEGEEVIEAKLLGDGKSSEQ